MGIQNYTMYNDEMSKSIKDKLFFTKTEYFNKIDTLIDIGCAEGELLAQVKQLNPNIICIGYDIDKTMIQHAKNLHSDILFVSNLNDLLTFNMLVGTCAVLFSSVLHEMFHYLSQQEIDSQLTNIITLIDPAYIIIRDMVHPKYKCCNDGLIKYCKGYAEQINKSNKFKPIIDSFQKQFGKNWDKNPDLVINFLLKYRYFLNGNWDREIQENYLSVDYDYLDNLFFKYRYLNKYIDYMKLSFIFDTIKDDFNIKYQLYTHTYLIYQNQSDKGKKVAFDIHGVLSCGSKIMTPIIKELRRRNVQINVISGAPVITLYRELKEKYNYDMSLFDNIYSTVDFLTLSGVDMWRDWKDTWWCAEVDWYKAKNLICKKYNIDILIDNELKYFIDMKEHNYIYVDDIIKHIDTLIFTIIRKLININTWR